MSIQQSEIKVLDQLLLVDLSGIHLWTARKKLKPEMLEGKIPPTILASLGSMRVIDPDKLKPFEKIKRQATKVVEECGVRFLGGYAVSQDKIQEVVDRLEVLKTQFYDLKNNFLPNYERWITEWINKGWEKQEWRDAIRTSVTPKEQVDAGMHFGYAACRVSPDGDKHLSNTLGTQVRGLSDQLYAETADTAERLLETGLATRGHVTQTTLNTVRKINAKLRGLMFLSSEVQALTEHIEEVLAALPKSGVVNGSQYNSVVALVSALSDEDSIKRLIKNLNIANDHQDVSMDFVPAFPSVESAAPAGVETEAPAAVEIESSIDIGAVVAVPAAGVPADAVSRDEEELGASQACPSRHKSINEVSATFEVADPAESVPEEQPDPPFVINPSVPGMPFGTFWF
ncbi:DUF3150 domain-containing protein [Pseudomonas brassicacearum]|uniref:DUF3150 domain-containing protein n=1 Tax=Pseudomonas brassicacearum TaxID=930166 RepID=UPI0006403710|nr:DUF3150 domain-containing protein [Pseudomonas brassicacearum]